VQHGKLGPALYRRLRRVWMSDVTIADAKARLTGEAPDEPCIDRAAAFFVVSWMGRSGMSGTASSNTTYSARYTHNGGHAARRWCAAVDSIPAWRRRMRELTILRKDGFALLERIE